VSASERDKGARAELEIVHLLRAEGWPDAERSSRGVGQAELGDIRYGPPAVHFEVRRRETIQIWKSLEQAGLEARAGYLPVLAFRRNRSPWYGALELSELLALLKLREL
jgi:hypothetical protein